MRLIRLRNNVDHHDTTRTVLASLPLSLPRPDDIVRVLSSLARLFAGAGFVRSVWKTPMTHMWLDAMSVDVGHMGDKLAF